MARIINTADLTPEALKALDANTSYWCYNGLDCCVTYDIFNAIHPQLDNVTTPTYEFSKSLQGPFLEMMMRGLRINFPRRRRVMDELSKKIQMLEHQLDSILRDGVGISNLNWRSPTQLNNLLYDVLQLPVQRKRNANGIYAPTSDREALENLQHYFIAEPIIRHLLTLRDCGKSLSFLETSVDPDGRMRTNFNIAGTNTGRQASSLSDYGTGTNLQNVARSLRSVFCADPGYVFINCDLEQADSRNLGALCWQHFLGELGEADAGRYLDACESGDLHTFVCRMCNPQLGWGIDGRTDRQIADQLFYRDKTWRDGAKVLGHGSNFLGTPITMAKHTKFATSLVKDFQRSYFGAFPCIPRYHRFVRNELEQIGALTTLYGRRRFFFGRHDDAATNREAVAYSPQSMTGDEINGGILKVWRGDKAQLLVQVHDSILAQCKVEEVDEVVPWMLETLRMPITLAKDRPFCVPTEAKVGFNWGEYDTADNPDGLLKWKGNFNNRQRVETDINVKAF